MADRVAWFRGLRITIHHRPRASLTKVEAPLTRVERWLALAGDERARPQLPNEELDGIDEGEHVYANLRNAKVFARRRRGSPGRAGREQPRQAPLHTSDINCTGPATNITTTADPLLRHLLDSGLARPDPLRLGLDTDDRGALRDAGGRPTAGIFTLGPLLRGRWYETTAIPEIRDQAATLARNLLTTQARASPGSAA